jgi:hypothetical protein
MKIQGEFFTTELTEVTEWESEISKSGSMSRPGNWQAADALLAQTTFSFHT